MSSNIVKTLHLSESTVYATIKLLNHLVTINNRLCTAATPANINKVRDIEFVSIKIL